MKTIQSKIQQRLANFDIVDLLEARDSAMIQINENDEIERCRCCAVIPASILKFNISLCA